jgi:hypothetical protein
VIDVLNGCDFVAKRADGVHDALHACVIAAPLR